MKEQERALCVCFSYLILIPFGWELLLGPFQREDQRDLACWSFLFLLYYLCISIFLLECSENKGKQQQPKPADSDFPLGKVSRSRNQMVKCLDGYGHKEKCCFSLPQPCSPMLTISAKSWAWAMGEMHSWHVWWWYSLYTYFIHTHIYMYAW